MAHFFFYAFSSSSFISLVNPHNPDRLSRLHFSKRRFEIRTMLLRHSKSQRTNTFLGLLDSALRSKRLRIMDRMDGHSCSIPPLCLIHTLSRITPAGAKTSPFQFHSTLLRFSSLLLSLNSVHIIQDFSFLGRTRTFMIYLFQIPVSKHLADKS